MAKAGLTGVTASSFPNLQLNAGVFIEGFDYKEIKTLSALETAVLQAIDSEKCLGATQGGRTFNSTPEIRGIELDGMRQAFKGSQIKDGVVVSIETTLKEITQENMRRVLCASDIAVEGDVVTIRERLDIDTEQDYIDSLSWVGDLLDGRIVMITLFNCMNTNGMSWESADKSEGNLPVTFTATNSSFADRAYAPYEIKIFNKPTVVTP